MNSTRTITQQICTSYKITETAQLQLITADNTSYNVTDDIRRLPEQKQDFEKIIFANIPDNCSLSQTLRCKLRAIETAVKEPYNNSVPYDVYEVSLSQDLSQLCITFPHPDIPDISIRTVNSPSEAILYMNEKLYTTVESNDEPELWKSSQLYEIEDINVITSNRTLTDREKIKRRMYAYMFLGCLSILTPLIISSHYIISVACLILGFLFILDCFHIHIQHQLQKNNTNFTDFTRYT
jgi:hypothetical protein